MSHKKGLAVTLRAAQEILAKKVAREMGITVEEVKLLAQKCNNKKKKSPCSN